MFVPPHFIYCYATTCTCIVHLCPARSHAFPLSPLFHFLASPITLPCFRTYTSNPSYKLVPSCCVFAPGIYYSSRHTPLHFCVPVTLLCTPVIHVYFFDPYPHHDSMPPLRFQPFQASHTLHLHPASSPCHPPVGNAAQ